MAKPWPGRGRAVPEDDETMMTSVRARLLLGALLLVAAAGCGTGGSPSEPTAEPPDTAAEPDPDTGAEPDPDPSEDAAQPAAEPADAAPASDVPDGVAVSGEGWSAVFPDEPEQFVEEVPLPELDLVLSTDVTVWDAGDEALAVMVAQIPVDPSSPTVADELRAQLFTTAANLGMVVEDSPLLEADGTFRGRDAVVVSDEPGELNALMFVEGATLFQVLHMTETIDGGAALRAFVDTLTISADAPEPTAAPADTSACTTALTVTAPDGATVTLGSANIRTAVGGQVITVFAANFPIEDHDVPGQLPEVLTDDGLLVWVDVGDPAPDSDAPVLGSGDTATFPDPAGPPFAASLITSERMIPLFGEDFAGTIEVRELSDDGACIALDVTVANTQLRGIAATDSVLRGD